MHRFPKKPAALSMVAMALSATWVHQVTAEDRCFGFFELREGVAYAVESEVWTFDHGGSANEGWTPEHVQAPEGPDFVRWQTLADFVNDGLPLGAPLVEGSGMIWGGVHEDEAAELCYECGLGYGPGIQTIRSPWIDYSGGDVQVSFQYFRDIADDVTFVVVQSDARTDEWVYLEWDFSARGDGAWNAPAEFTDTIRASSLDSATQIRIQFVLASSFIPTDADCGYDSEFGAFGVDDVQLSGGATAAYDFESGPEGWQTFDGMNLDPNPYFEVRDLASYGLGYETWNCGPADNVMTFNGPGLLPDNRTDAPPHPSSIWDRSGTPNSKHWI